MVCLHEWQQWMKTFSTLVFRHISSFNSYTLTSGTLVRIKCVIQLKSPFSKPESNLFKSSLTCGVWNLFSQFTFSSCSSTSAITVSKFGYWGILSDIRSLAIWIIFVLFSKLWHKTVPTTTNMCWLHEWAKRAWRREREKKKREACRL